MKTALTDRAVKAAKPKARAYDMHDAVVPGLLVEVRPSGVKRLALLKRFPGSRNPTMSAALAPTVAANWNGRASSG